MLKKSIVFFAAVIALSAHAENQSSPAKDGVAGESAFSISAQETETLAMGYSAKKMILGKAVYNGVDKKSIGTVHDIIVTPDKSVSFAIIDVGGFLGMDRKQVAVPAGLFKMENGKVILADASQQSLKSMPAFRYSR
jgi:sporulation protein YlmC with PRC-barrel domain